MTVLAPAIVANPPQPGSCTRFECSSNPGTLYWTRERAQLQFG
jgi:hypothetical protein